MAIVLTLVLGLGGAALVVWLGAKVSRGRRADRAGAVEAAVAPRGLTRVEYDAEAVDPWRRRLSGGGGPLDRRPVHHLGLMYTGVVAGRRCRLVDYPYRSGEGVRSAAVLAVDLGREVPALDVRPHGVLSWVDDRLSVGFGEVVDDVPAAPGDPHRVRSVDPAFARALVTPAFAQALAAHAPVVLATVGSDLLLIERDPLTPEAAQRLLAQAEALLAAAPPGVLA